ncbi:MAG: hypothetical protein KI790_04700 [Cyclobacteriaceae bacterium]|nr:hypothetical protein [Cyclobacteriaceae bacterium HetDA_MAG_MS6]
MAHRLQWVHFEGEMVASIRYYEYKINLYMLGGFYVEVFFHHLRDRIEKVDILDYYSSRMKFYTDQIRLPKDISRSNV